MSSRHDILAAIRAHRPQGEFLLPDIPLYDGVTEDLVARFSTALKKMGGRVIDAAEIPARLAGAAVTVSQVPEFIGHRKLNEDTRQTELADIDIAVLRAAFAVAETGSIALTERELGITGLGYLPQQLIILLDPADIDENLHNACRRPEYRHANYTVLHTGPSATADIEGVLIHGAQGVRSLSVAFVARQ